MKKIFSLIMLSLSLFLAVFLFVPNSVLADGMMVRNDPFSDRWDYADESNQQAYINYENGLQKMIISVGAEEEDGNGTVWLFPVPAGPSKVKIDVVKNLPKLEGEEISEKAKSNLYNFKRFLQMTQIYTVPFIFYSHAHNTTGALGAASPLGSSKGLSGLREPEVSVFEHLEKDGITSEVITAKTGNGLFDYLKNRGLRIDSGAIPVLDNYIGKNYSFIVSWLNSPNVNTLTLSQKINIIFKQLEQDTMWGYFIRGVYPETKKLIDNVRTKYPDFDRYNLEYLESEKGQTIIREILQTIKTDPVLTIEASEMKLREMRWEESNYKPNQKGIFVSFPTEDLYFPLIPTSVYGDVIVPATIKIIGHVSPKVFGSIKDYTKTGHYVGRTKAFPEDLKIFYDGQDESIKYTKIEINAPSKFFTDDLWIKSQAPIKTYYLSFISLHPVISVIIFLVLSSIIAGIFAGMLVFKDLRKRPVKLALIGLSNVLTILGLLITTILTGTKSKSEAVEPLLMEIKQKGYFWRRRVAMIIFFIATPFVISGLLSLLAIIINYFDHFKYFDTRIIFTFLFVYSLPIIIFTLGFMTKRIKLEDKKLFEQLKSSGYSSWSFHPKDKLKFAYVPLFSVSFLAISWLLVKLVLLTI